MPYKYKTTFKHLIEDERVPINVGDMVYIKKGKIRYTGMVSANPFNNDIYINRGKQYTPNEFGVFIRGGQTNIYDHLRCDKLDTKGKKLKPYRDLIEGRISIGEFETACGKKRKNVPPSVPLKKVTSEDFILAAKIWGSVTKIQSIFRMYLSNKKRLELNKHKLEKMLAAQKEYSELYEKICKLSNENKWGDPFAPGRGREIYMANYLGHIVGPNLSGADAYEDKEMKIPVEYKSTTQKKIQATFNGISVQDTWEKQIEYLKTEKICKYKHHYFSRFEDGEIKEIYKMTGDKVYEHIVPKLKKKFERKKKGKDPRLGASIPERYILANSEKLL